MDNRAGPRRSRTLCMETGVGHYENFPVASWLCPPALRPAVAAIYHYARTADDLADEGEAPPAERLADLAAYRAELHSVAQGMSPSPRWAGVFRPLAAALASHRLPLPLLDDLLSAFEQDVTKTRYTDRAELLDYCRRSANPVGRLLLHLYGVADAAALRRSDAVCSALQLINFWQDLSVDLPRGRLYLPLDRCAAHGVAPDSLFAQRDDAATRALVASECAWARGLMLEGAPLVHQVPGRAGWELRGVVQGGLRVLDKIAALGHATLAQRPVLQRRDLGVIVWRALAMRA
jgi:squalene synthase HpnC